MSRFSHSLIEVIVRILKLAGEPICRLQIYEEAAKIFGDEWSDTVEVNLSHTLTALRTLGILSQPKYAYWGLTPDAEAKLAAYSDLTDDEVYKEYEKLKPRK